MPMWWMLAAAFAADPVPEALTVTAEHRGLLVGMPQLASRLEGLAWDREAETVTSSRLADGTLDILYSYTPKDRDGQVDSLHHNVLVNYMRPSQAHDVADLELGVKLFTRSFDWERVPIEPSPLGWGEVNLCYLVKKRNTGEPTGTLCIASKDRYTVIYAVDGLLLKDPGSMDALLGESLEKLLRVRP
jgi:hypothetical protein